MSWWNQYSAESIGRMIHFVYRYTTMMVAESATFSNKEVMWGREKVADVLEHKEVDVNGVKLVIPIFKFVGKYEYGNQQQEYYQKHASMELTEYRETFEDQKVYYAKMWEEQEKARIAFNESCGVKELNLHEAKKVIEEDDGNYGGVMSQHFNKED